MSAALNHPLNMRLLGSGRAYQQDLLALMARVELLADFSGREPEMLSHYLQAYAADPGCVIFHEGEPGHYMCLLVSGRVKTSKESDIEHSAEVANESRGRSIGEMALIDGEPRSATCVATEPSVLLLLNQEEFQRLCEERPALALKLLMRITKLMSRRLRLTSGRLVDYLGA
jgi:CRP/FNR family cyclic AMP-dependent transcriptional regulator